jgi:hypothetical protein
MTDLKCKNEQLLLIRRRKVQKGLKNSNKITATKVPTFVEFF